MNEENFAEKFKIEYIPSLENVYKGHLLFADGNASIYSGKKDFAKKLGRYFEQENVDWKPIFAAFEPAILFRPRFDFAFMDSNGLRDVRLFSYKGENFIKVKGEMNSGYKFKSGSNSSKHIKLLSKNYVENEKTLEFFLDIPMYIKKVNVVKDISESLQEIESIFYNKNI